MKCKNQYGFTIVEILIVIVVIAILAIITAASYNNARLQADDAKLADGIDKISDALQLWISKNGHFPAGGIGSTTPIGGATECTNGANGYFVSGVHTCTVEDVLVAGGYLPAGFGAGLADNAAGKIMLYNDAVNRKAMLYWQMSDLSAKDTAHLNAQITKCGAPTGGANDALTTGYMNNGICITY